MLLDFGHIAVFILLSIAIIAMTLVIGKALRPNNPYPEKLLPYECGEDVIGTPWIKYNIRFYIFALLFLIFEVEIALIFPTVMIFREWAVEGLAQGFTAFLEIAFFMVILIFALAYAWAKGDLAWIKTLIRNQSGGA